MTSVLQLWVMELPMMQQTVLLTAVRGPDGSPKYGPVKMLLRWYRRCVLLSAMDGRALTNPYENNGGSFTGPSLALVDGADPRAPTRWPAWEASMQELVSEYLRATDALPHHFQMHFMHAVEILGYKHPNTRIRMFWRATYDRLARDLHLTPETESAMDERLGDRRDGWLKHADPATVE